MGNQPSTSEAPVEEAPPAPVGKGEIDEEEEQYEDTMKVPAVAVLDNEDGDTLESLNVALPQGIKLTGGVKLRDAGYTGIGVKVAVIDSGIDETHPGFNGKVTVSYNTTIDTIVQYSAVRPFDRIVFGIFARLSHIIICIHITPFLSIAQFPLLFFFNSGLVPRTTLSIHLPPTTHYPINYISTHTILLYDREKYGTVMVRHYHETSMGRT